MKTGTTHFSAYIFLLAIILISIASFGQALNSYFWKDDWAWLWSSNHNPQDFFHSTIGEDWIIRTGVFMHPYVLFLHRTIQNSQIWQLIGLILKIINSVLVYFLFHSITKKKYTAVWGALLYASFSGGIESYTWHKLNAVATAFVIIGFRYFNEFLNNQKIKNYLIAYSSFMLAMCSYLGRSAGIVSVCMLWGALVILDKSVRAKGKLIIGLSLSGMMIPYLFLVSWVGTRQTLPEGYIQLAISKNHQFFGIIGNLLKNPFIKINEIGYLASIDNQGILLGRSLLAIFILLGCIYAIKRFIFLRQALFFLGWIFLFYFPNWIYGGGGIDTILGSGHRYLAVSAIGVIGLWTILLSNLNKKIGFVIFSILLLLSLKYSDHVIKLESTVRNRHLVEPIYRQIFEYLKEDDKVELIVIDTPNVLASFVVGGWYPYTYAYHKGLDSLLKFPVVISRMGIGEQWACAKSVEEKKIVQGLGGFGDAQNLPQVSPNHIYAWSLSENGELTNRTDSFRSKVTECLSY